MQGFCGAAFDVPARTNLNDEPEMNIGNCTGIPGKISRPLKGLSLASYLSADALQRQA